MPFEVVLMPQARGDLATAVHQDDRRAVQSRIYRLSTDQTSTPLDGLGALRYVTAVNGRYRILIMVKDAAEKVVVVGISRNPRGRR